MYDVQWGAASFHCRQSGNGSIVSKRLGTQGVDIRSTSLSTPDRVPVSHQSVPPPSPTLQNRLRVSLCSVEVWPSISTPLLCANINSSVDFFKSGSMGNFGKAWDSTN